jgi:hypothetical protein
MSSSVSIATLAKDHAASRRLLRPSPSAPTLRNCEDDKPVERGGLLLRGHMSMPLLKRKPMTTRLHLLAQKIADVTVQDVQACLVQDPQASSGVDSFGRTPLFYAIQNCTIYHAGNSVRMDIIQVLFEAHPPAMTLVDHCGESPLCLLYHPNRSAALLALVLSLDPALLLTGSTQTFSHRSFWQRVLEPWIQSAACLNEEPVVPHGTTSHETWQKLVVSVAAVHRVHFSHYYPCYTAYDTRRILYFQHHSVGNSSFPPVLHMALQLRLAPSILCHLMRMYPAQVAMKIQLGTADDDDSQSSIRHDLLPLHYYVSQSADQVNCAGMELAVAALIRHYPLAVQQPLPGTIMLPLHAALASKWGWSRGIQTLVAAYPEAMTLSCNSWQYPFLLAAMSTEDTTAKCKSESGNTASASSSPVGTLQRMSKATEDGQLETIYMLLREGPCARLRDLVVTS